MVQEGLQGGAGWCRKDCRVEQEGLQAKGGAGRGAGWSRMEGRVEQEGGAG